MELFQELPVRNLGIMNHFPLKYFENISMLSIIRRVELLVMLMIMKGTIDFIMVSTNIFPFLEIEEMRYLSIIRSKE